MGKLVVAEFMSLDGIIEDPGVAGSATPVAALREHDLVDEYRLMVHPVVLAARRPVVRPFLRAGAAGRTMTGMRMSHARGRPG